MTIIEKYFTLPDVLSAIMWLVVLSFVVVLKSTKLTIQKDKTTYILNFYFKVFFAIVFSVSYLVMYGGGDTTAYWDGAECIQNLLWDEPIKGIEHLFTTPTRANYYTFFNTQTGFPPSWIYPEAESYFVSKVTAIVGLFTFKSYLATTFIFSYFFATANWKIYEVARRTKLFKQRYLALAILFVPSVSFWCAGVSKDTVIFIAILMVFYYLYTIIIEKKYNFRLWMLLLFYLWIIYSARTFMLVVVLVPLLIVLVAHFNKRFNFSPIIRIPINIMLTTIIIGGATAYLSSDKGKTFILQNGFLQEALVVQNDFKNNQFYGKNQYDIGKIENTPIGIISKMPISIFSGIFQPLPWNALSPTLILNGIESALLIFLILQLIVSRQIINWALTIQKNELLLFCLVFVIIIAFMAGFTSILYGVLVRLRAPLLPFLMCLFTIIPNILKKDNKELLYSPLEK